MNMESKDLNRLKIVLVEKKRTAKWLAEELQNGSKFLLGIERGYS